MNTRCQQHGVWSEATVGKWFAWKGAADAAQSLRLPFLRSAYPAAQPQAGQSLFSQGIKKYKLRHQVHRLFHLALSESERPRVYCGCTAVTEKYACANCDDASYTFDTFDAAYTNDILHTPCSLSMQYQYTFDTMGHIPMLYEASCAASSEAKTVRGSSSTGASGCQSGRLNPRALRRGTRVG